MMTKWLTGLISAAAIIAAVSILGARTQAADLPPCTKTLNDHCIQMGGETMQPSPEVKAKQQENVKAVGKKAGEIGGKIEEMGQKAKMKMQKMMGGSQPSSEIPHGCSPATTPCE